LAVDGKQEPSEWDDCWTLSSCRQWSREEVEGRKIDAEWIEKIEGGERKRVLTFKETRSEKKLRNYSCPVPVFMVLTRLSLLYGRRLLVALQYILE
jgi:hypothetical protein